MPYGWRDFYRPLIATLIEAGPQIGVAAVLFAAASALGAINPRMGAAALEAFREFAQSLMGKGTVELVVAIFLRNSMAAAVAIAGGVFFGFFPLAAILFNGILLGTVLRIFSAEAWRIIPHGILELPAMFIAWGLGLWVGMSLLEPPRLRHIRERLRAALRVFIGLLLPLLAAAAVIEGIAAHLYRR